MSSISQSIKNLIRHGMFHPICNLFLHSYPATGSAQIITNTSPTSYAHMDKDSSHLISATGKGGRASQQPHDDPTTHVSPVNVHNSRHQEHAPPQHPNNHYANSDPTMNQQHNLPHGGEAYSTADLDNRNRGAQAGNVAAHAAEQKQKKNKKVDHDELARIVAEENESKGKLPRYPDLQRWQLIEKMGDGAFSNVYRARDLEGQAGEVAIKVVRKFEMNSGQVSRDCIRFLLLLVRLLGIFANMCGGLGRSSPSSGFQEAAQDCGGAQTFLFTASGLVAFFPGSTLICEL